MIKLNYRYGQSFLLLFSVLILVISYYFEYVKSLEPCPLCIMQRVCILFFILVCVMALKVSRHRSLLCGLQCFFALAGLYFSGRQLWLQSLPPEQTPACLPGLDVMIHYFPWRDTLHALIWGAGDCAEVSWRWLGLSMPGWAALAFTLMMAAAFFIQHQWSRS